MNALNVLDRQHLGLFEVRIKAIVAMRLGVFGAGVQMEDELMSAIEKKDAKAAELIKTSITAHGHWVEASECGAPDETLETLQLMALLTSKGIEDHLIATPVGE